MFATNTRNSLLFQPIRKPYSILLSVSLYAWKSGLTSLNSTLRVDLHNLKTILLTRKMQLQIYL